ncbi:MAG: fatty acyl-AMP ligase [Pseudomonadota bacterium]
MNVTTESLQAATPGAVPTPTTIGKEIELKRFETITDALDFAALAGTGVNFYDLKGGLASSATYADVRDQAQVLAQRLAARFDRGDRIAIVAETSMDFVVLFFACQYAGMLPAPMPLPVNLGGKEGYLIQVRQMVTGADARAALCPPALKPFIEEATADCDNVAVIDFEEARALPVNGRAAIPFGPGEDCYIQYSSGSTSAPKGVVGTQQSVTSNLHAITKHGLKLTQHDRAVSWLPLYHDMGLIGFVLSPMFGQRSVDYIATSDFVRRPLLWWRVLTANKATITYSPSFGYDLSSKRAARAQAGDLDLSTLRIAGIGGDMVRPDALNAFTEAFKDFGFKKDAFVPSYGLAESTLAIAFTEIDAPLTVDAVDMRLYDRTGVAQPAGSLTAPEQRREFVLCGAALPGHAIEIRENGEAIKEDRRVGRVFIKGPSLTRGYYSDEAASEAMFDGDWLDTGDMGYLLNGQLVITGRAKDLIIINGRNIWPQDIEWAVEKIEGVRQGGVAAFSVDTGDGERIIVVAERRGMADSAITALRREVASVIQSTVGAPAEIVLTRPHTMVITSSGKLSRAKVKAKYLSGALTDAKATADQEPLAEARV